MSRKCKHTGRDKETKLKIDVELYLDEFLSWRKLEVTHYTIINFRNVLSRFFKQYGYEVIQKESDLLYAVKSFIQPMKAGYFNKTLQALRQFFEYLRNEGVINKNPCDGISFKPYKPRIVNLDDGVIRQLIELSDKDTFSGERLPSYSYVVDSGSVRMKQCNLLRRILTFLRLKRQGVILVCAWNRQ